MKIISLFSGAGLFDAGLINAGNEILLQCEKEPVQLKILQETFPGTIKHDDILHFLRRFSIIWNRHKKSDTINQNSSHNLSDLPTTVDLASFWLKMCKDSLTTLTAQLGYQVEWQKSVISGKYFVSRLKLSVPHTKGKESSRSTVVINFYPTPTASSGTWESLQLTKYHKQLHRASGTDVLWLNPEFDAWLMGMDAYLNLLKNVWKLSGMESSTMSDSSLENP